MPRSTEASLADRINAATRRIPAWPLYLLAILPPAWLLWQGLTGGLGVDPVKEMEHQMGLWGLQVLIASLCITPLRRFAGINLLRYRRAIGLVGFFYILLHLLVWLVLDVQIPEQIWADIVKRPYITIGMAGFLMLVPLAITSNNLSIRKMGAAAWRRLHKLAYFAVLAGGVHYVMLVKGWQIEPLIYLAVTALLVATRLSLRWPRRRSPGPSTS
ncbi:protein-methionine-sulfoxide reductase heme-binding subunit MsrQ [Pseudoruegeria sp. SHC-113]|uniref:protein-methionine-sulfoxide reductase heme-binding subunit MsrQ n=1 Tax=Pseudoruegeria sp. SHC-113 TaxID=2855439 RepID=UPI0021BAF117|nr:protein-methionine-sulfoxide reductase heme-binding subunit MsrQ [Pseudoruegeria sp. SHC-113]MCT8158455.1 protein-methionine-sulfoxide reductase heme-binding subunit MsrQ [Pseudoruegeria sp. SHC-113]